MEKDGMKHNQKVYILFWLHFYSHLSFLSKLIVTLYMLLFLNTSCTSLFEIWNVLSANLTPQVENSTADLMRWSSRQRAETDKVTFRLFVWVRSTDRSVLLRLGSYPQEIHTYICSYMYTRVCECIHTYIHNICISIPKPTILVRVSFAVMKYYD